MLEHEREYLETFIGRHHAISWETCKKRITCSIYLVIHQWVGVCMIAFSEPVSATKEAAGAEKMGIVPRREALALMATEKTQNLVFTCIN